MSRILAHMTKRLRGITRTPSPPEEETPLSYITFKRASAVSGLSVRQLQRYVGDGTLTAYQLGETRWVRLRKADVLRLFEARPIPRVPKPIQKAQRHDSVGKNCLS